MLSYNASRMHDYHTRQEADEAYVLEAQEELADVSAYIQGIFTALNKALASNPRLALLVDEVAIRQDVEAALLGTPAFEEEIHDRLRNFDGVTVSEALTYNTGK